MALLKSSAKKRAGATTPPPSKPKRLSLDNIGKGTWFVTGIFLAATILVTITLDVLFFGEGQTVVKNIWYWIALFGGITLGASYIAQNKRDISILTKVSWVVIIVSLGLCLIKGLNPELNPREKIQGLVSYLQTEDIYGGPIEQYQAGVHSFTLDSGEVLDHWITLPPNTGQYTSYAQSETNRFDMIFMTSNGIKIANIEKLLEEEKSGEIPSYNPLQLKLRALEKQVIIFTVEKS